MIAAGSDSKTRNDIDLVNATTVHQIGAHGEGGRKRNVSKTASLAREVNRRQRGGGGSSINAGCARFPLERMHRLHQMLFANEYPNCTTVAAQFEVSTKTIQRDFEFMRDRLRLPIEYDGKHFGYYYTHPIHHFLHGLAENTPDSLLLRRERQTLLDSDTHYPVHIRLSQNVAEKVGRFEWIGCRVVKRQADGSIEMELRMKSIAALEQWLLHQAAHAGVLKT